MNIPDPDRGSPPTLLPTVGAAFVVAFGGALLAASVLSYGTVAAFVDSLAPDGDAGNFTVTRFQRVVWGLRALGAVLLASGWLLHRLRARVGFLILRLTGSTRDALRDVRGYCRRLTRFDPPGHRRALVTVFTVGAGLAAYFAVTAPMRYDEAYTFLTFASQSPVVVLSDYFTTNNHIFHSALVHLVHRMLGSDPWMLRLPALAAGVLLVPAVYVVARALTDRRIAVVTAALVAVSPPLVGYASNARGYSIMWLCFFVLLVLGLRLLRKPDDLFTWAAFVIVTAVGHHTLPVMLMPFAGTVTWLTVVALSRDVEGAPDWRLVRRTATASLAAGAAVLVLYAPVLLNTGLESLVGRIDLPFDQFLRYSRIFVAEGWTRVHAGLPGWVAACGALAAVLGAVTLRRRAVVSALLVSVLGAHLVIMFVQQGLFYGRRWYYMLPLYLLLVAAGLVLLVDRAADRAPWRRLQGLVTPEALAALLVFVLAIRSVATSSPLTASDSDMLREVESVAEFLDSRIEPSDRIAAKITADAPLAYYLDRRGVPARVFCTDSKTNHARPRATCPGRDGRGRTYVVVNRRRGSLQSVLEARDVELPSHGDARLVFTEGKARVYLLGPGPEDRGGEGPAPESGS